MDHCHHCPHHCSSGRVAPKENTHLVAAHFVVREQRWGGCVVLSGPWVQCSEEVGYGGQLQKPAWGQDDFVCVATGV